VNRHLRRHAELERLFGADFLPISRKTGLPTQASPTPPPAAPRASLPAKKETRPPASEAPGPAYPKEFEEFRRQVLGCTKCGLCTTRTQVVFGVGPLGAPLMFVGEAPGGDEDEQGEPFVGRAGQLLTKTLKKIGVERNRVYIANILKCRPPDNRTPQFDEMSACMPWLLRQIQYVKPKILCALGNIAAQTLLNTKTGITRLRGKYAEALGVKIFPTFHPAYVLRNMGELGIFETDLRKACRDAGL
jgi:DNA polymerase